MTTTATALSPHALASIAGCASPKPSQTQLGYIEPAGVQRTEDGMPIAEPEMHGYGWHIERGEEGQRSSWIAPGYCWCNKWGDHCEGLAALRRGDVPFQPSASAELV